MKLCSSFYLSYTKERLAALSLNFPWSFIFHQKDNWEIKVRLGREMGSRQPQFSTDSRHMNVGDSVPSGLLCGKIPALPNWVSVSSLSQISLLRKLLGRMERRASELPVLALSGFMLASRHPTLIQRITSSTCWGIVHVFHLLTGSDPHY